MHPRSRTDFDVVVAGAGPAGAATALRLASAGCRVALIERSRFDRPRAGESLAPAVQPELVALGLWDRFLALNPLPSWGTRSLWGDETPHEHAHMMSAYGRGWHVDRVSFDRMVARAAEAAGAQVMTGTTIVASRPAGDGTWLVELADRERTSRILHAELVIDATGRTANLARRLGAGSIVFDRLVGITVQTAGIESSLACYLSIESTRDGWWYAAPMPENQTVAVLFTDADLCGRSNMATAVEWWGRLNATSTTRSRVLDPSPHQTPRVFSAISQRTRRNESQARWLTVGDAALAVDPISGSGVVRAFRTAKAGTETALALLDGTTGDVLADYEAERDRECALYLEERAIYYGLERRWPDAPFWARRFVRPPASTPAHVAAD